MARTWRQGFATAVSATLALTGACSDHGPPTSITPPPTDSSVRWTLVSSPTTQRLSSVKMTGITTGFAVGDSGTYLYYGGGTAWGTVNVGPTQHQKNFYGIEANGSGPVWLVGDSGTLLYAPTTYGGWSQQTTNALITLFSISRASGTSELFAVGAGGVMMRSLDGGSTWTSQLSPTADSLFFVGGLADTNFFAAGQAGTGAHFNGTTWNSDFTGVGVDLRSGAAVGTTMTPLTDVWFVGDSGMILHSPTGASGTWSVQPSATTQNLFGITADSATRAFAVGAAGTILHWDGTTWRLMVTPTRTTLRAIARGFSAPVDYWIVGDEGTILHGTR